MHDFHSRNRYSAMCRRGHSHARVFCRKSPNRRRLRHASNRGTVQQGPNTSAGRGAVAVDDLGLDRMHLKSAFCQPGLKRSLEGLCFLLGPAVHETIIGIPTPWKIRVRPSQRPADDCGAKRRLNPNSRAQHAPSLS